MKPSRESANFHHHVKGLNSCWRLICESKLVNLSEKNRGRRFESTHNVDSESIWKDRKEKFSCWVDWLNKCMGKLHDKAFLSDHRLIFRLSFTIVVSMGLLAGEWLVTQDPHRHWKLSRSALGWESKKLKNSFTKNFVVINAPWTKPFECHGFDKVIEKMPSVHFGSRSLMRKDISNGNKKETGRIKVPPTLE